MNLRAGSIKKYIYKIEKPLARLTNKKEKTLINKIRKKIGEITMYTTEIQRIIGEHYEQLYTKQ